MTDKTHFGYEEVAVEEKAGRVGAVFSSVAGRYDLMNDLMSFGMHRLWKHAFITLCALHKGQKVLDLATGSADLAKAMAKKVGDNGLVVASDINRDMLLTGRDKLCDQGLVSNTQFCLANAEHLPFISNYFDRVTIGFGLRNVTHIDAALASMYRVLKPGGRALILEFSKTNLPALKKLYDAYSFSVLPFLGKVICRDADSYRYLAESIRMHPDQKTLVEKMQQAGFEDCQYHNMSGGIVAVHIGHKY